MYLQRNNELRSRNSCCLGKAISITYSEWVYVPSVVQHAKYMRLIILSSIECLGLSYFSKLSHEGHNFRKKNAEHKMSVFLFPVQICLTKFSL